MLSEWNVSSSSLGFLVHQPKPILHPVPQLSRRLDQTDADYSRQLQETETAQGLRGRLVRFGAIQGR